MLAERVPMERARLRASGLSRQASRNTTLVLPSRSSSICLRMKSTRDRLEVEVALALQAGIDRDQVVAARHLQPVAGVEEHRGIRAIERAGEIAHLGVEAALVDIEAEHDRRSPTSVSAAAMSAASLTGLASGVLLT